MRRKRLSWTVLWGLAYLAVSVWVIARGNGVLWAIYTGALAIWVLLTLRKNNRAEDRR
ncbi:hypothetical protein [Kocuria kalidii]|uniref:hypothetical protein n=1 Tax=Kocuria kalidii TaxID=3376283 RepID=UPI00378E53A9